MSPNGMRQAQLRFEWRVPVMLLVLTVIGTTAMPRVLNGEGRRQGAVIDQERKITVWDGVYTEQQARRGETTYRQECSSCHYDDLQGQGSTPSLIGSTFFFQWGDRSIDDLLTAVRTTMPQGAGEFQPRGLPRRDCLPAAVEWHTGRRRRVAQRA